MMEKSFSLTLHLFDDERFEVDLYEHKSGDRIHISGKHFDDDGNLEMMVTLIMRHRDTGVAEDDRKRLKNKLREMRNLCREENDYISTITVKA